MKFINIFMFFLILSNPSFAENRVGTGGVSFVASGKSSKLCEKYLKISNCKISKIVVISNDGTLIKLSLRFWDIADLKLAELDGMIIGFELKDGSIITEEDF